MALDCDVQLGREMQPKQNADVIPGMPPIVCPSQYSFIGSLKGVRARLFANSVQGASPRLCSVNRTEELNCGHCVSDTGFHTYIDGSRSFQATRGDSLEEKQDATTPVAVRGPSYARLRSRTAAEASQAAGIEVIPCLGMHKEWKYGT